MDKIEIITPKGHKMIEEIVNGIKQVSFVPTEEKLHSDWDTIAREIFIGKKVYWIDSNCKIESGILSQSIITESCKNVHLSKERAEAFLYLQMLITARDLYNDGFVFDWSVSNNQTKYNIYVCNGSIQINNTVNAQYILHFKSEEIRDTFLTDFREWIEKAKELI